jgi:hypothetical protein
MSTVDTDRLVDDYLRRLEAAAAHLPPTRRAELVVEIRDHIRDAIGEHEAADDAAVLNVLERLGEPEEIVAAAEPPPTASPRPRWIDVAAVLALVLPFLGWFVGSVLVLISRAWSRRDKVIGLLLLLLPVLALGLGVLATGTSGMDESLPPGEELPVGVQEEGPPDELGALGLVVVISGVPSALYLAWRLRPDRHPRSTPA